MDGRRVPLMNARPSMQPTAMLWRQTPQGNFLWHRQQASTSKKGTIMGFGYPVAIAYALTLLGLFAAGAVLIGLGTSSSGSSSNDANADLSSLKNPDLQANTGSDGSTIGGTGTGIDPSQLGGDAGTGGTSAGGTGATTVTGGGGTSITGGDTTTITGGDTTTITGGSGTTGTGGSGTTGTGGSGTTGTGGSGTTGTDGSGTTGTDGAGSTARSASGTPSGGSSLTATDATAGGTPSGTDASSTSSATSSGTELSGGSVFADTPTTGGTPTGGTPTGGTPTGGTPTGGGGSTVTSAAASTTGSGFGDPHFIGFDGTSYDFHGHAGGFFNILSEDMLQVNSEFMDQDQGAGWTFMRSIGIKYRPAKAKLSVSVAGPGKLLVQLNGKTLLPAYKQLNMKLGNNSQLQYTVRTSASANSQERDTLYFESPHFAFKFYILPEQLHINMEAELRTFQQGLDVHGVLGQTFGWVLADDETDYHQPEGEDGDYEVSSLFADDFHFNKYDTQSWTVIRGLDGHVSRRLLELP